jgi:hypothetical protein
MSALSLVDVLARMPDPRSRHGQYHPLPAILGLVVLAMLMGRTSLIGIARFGRQYGYQLAWALGFRRGKTLSVSTLSRTLRRLDANKLEDLIAEWIGSRITEPIEIISLDGKTLRGSKDGELPGVHLISAYATQMEAVLRQIRVDSDTNEHKTALKLLGILSVKKRIVIGDAIFCQRDLAEAIDQDEGDYIFAVKDNQEGLKKDIEAGFAFEDQCHRNAMATSPWGGKS